jgi:hypothetical protein
MLGAKFARRSCTVPPVLAVPVVVPVVVVVPVPVVVVLVPVAVPEVVVPVVVLELVLPLVVVVVEEVVVPVVVPLVLPPVVLEPPSSTVAELQAAMPSATVAATRAERRLGFITAVLLISKCRTSSNSSNEGHGASAPRRVMDKSCRRSEDVGHS